MIRPNCTNGFIHIARNGFQALAEVPRGRRVRIQGLDGGERLAGRLAEMGLFKGASVEILSGGGRGPVIVRSGSSRLALGRGMVHRMLVTAAADPPAGPAGGA